MKHLQYKKKKKRKYTWKKVNENYLQKNQKPINTKSYLKNN